jgi:hypothetical protein
VVKGKIVPAPGGTSTTNTAPLIKQGHGHACFLANLGGGKACDTAADDG